MRSTSVLLAGALAAVTALPAAVLPAAARPNPERGAGVQELVSVRAAVETAPNWDDEAGGDADADDPAIWVDAVRPERSVVLGTLKNGGLTVVDLAGRQLQHVGTPPAPAPGREPGRFNNVDLVQNVRLGGRVRDLAVVTDRGRDQLRVYAVDRRGAGAGNKVLADVTSPNAPLVFSKDTAEVQDQRTAYGVAVIADPAGPLVAVSRRSETRIGLFRLVTDGPNISYRPVTHWDFPASFELRDGSTWSPCADPGDRPQFEGMVFDRTTRTLYAAQEDVGIWRIPPHGRPQLVEKVREFGQPAEYDESTEECVPTGPPALDAGQHLSADAEGLTIAYRHGTRTLYASSQGDSTFAVYRLDARGLSHRAGFQVADGPATDGVQHSDGAAVSTRSLGARFPHGLLAVHDGENTPGDGDREGTNFKLVRLEQVP
ncbi:3-phytase [Kribbella flavida DSM 17836]|uniref:3-phytase n=1 Tax=Kribbella flavida (strain DSM 17836 / JCM 10339 / NBRC 14399) TaxID=479435 RepID=D2Q2G1_KRIFD|nr:phytase [Kribbella flavida]ADB35857.1 3-phytase [Kribbella flavida DSM 17836]